MKTLIVTKYDELNEFATLLAENGFTIISSFDENKPSFNSYFNFSKNGYFGYCQKERFEGFSLSTVNKPCREYGTGHNYRKGWDILTLEHADGVLSYCKSLILTCKAIVNYSSLEKFVENSITGKRIIN